MKGEAQVIERLNEALFLELGAVNQYWVHFRLLADWGYQRLAAKERAETAVLQDYLPEQLGPEEIAAVVAAAVEKLGAAGSGPKAMGQVMGIVSPQVKGRADGAAVAAEVEVQLVVGVAERPEVRHVAVERHLPTDISVDHEFTDWNEVSAFVEKFAAIEGLDAHGRSATIRLGKKS